jgi:hypothetical protein
MYRCYCTLPRESLLRLDYKSATNGSRNKNDGLRLANPLQDCVSLLTCLFGDPRGAEVCSKTCLITEIQPNRYRAPSLDMTSRIIQAHALQGAFPIVIPKRDQSWQSTVSV